MQRDSTIGTFYEPGSLFAMAVFLSDKIGAIVPAISYLWSQRTFSISFEEEVEIK
jgi:hypothetical protein